MTTDDTLLNGSKIAADIRDEVAARVAELADRGITPRLDAVLVGDDPASKIYVGSKARTSAELGMRSETHELPADTPQAELEALVDRLNQDDEVDGLSLIHISEPTRLNSTSRMPSSA